MFDYCEFLPVNLKLFTNHLVRRMFNIDIAATIYTGVRPSDGTSPTCSKEIGDRYENYS